MVEICNIYFYNIGNRDIMVDVLEVYIKRVDCKWFRKSNFMWIRLRSMKGLIWR